MFGAHGTSKQLRLTTKAIEKQKAELVSAPRECKNKTGRRTGPRGETGNTQTATLTAAKRVLVQCHAD
jgi:hypothetical protein